MTSLPDVQVNISSTVSSTIRQIPTIRQVPTMPSYTGVRNPQGRLHPPYPRPTVSLDPRPVVIPILSSVIGFPIVVFALICALRRRAIRLRKKDQLKKLQAGVRSVTLDLPPREKISYFSGGSSPEISLKDVGEKLETAVSPTGVLKSSLSNTGLRRNNSTSKNNNHVKFVTPSTTLDVSHTLQVDVVLHSIERLNGSPWKHGRSSQETIEGGITVHKEDEEDSPR